MPWRCILGRHRIQFHAIIITCGIISFLSSGFALPLSYFLTPIKSVLPWYWCVPWRCIRGLLARKPSPNCAKLTANQLRLHALTHRVLFVARQVRSILSASSSVWYSSPELSPLVAPRLWKEVEKMECQYRIYITKKRKQDEEITYQEY